MLNNYDPIAPYYDTLSRLVFHRAQLNAQIDQLNYIQLPCRMLIVGGGTGWILEELSKIHAAELSITYVEISAKMTALAKKRNIAQNNIEFINCAIEDFTASGHYDVVHTAFLFDNFAAKRAEIVFNKLNDLLKPGGLWLFSDFCYEPGKDSKWKGILLRLMYRFFRKITQTEARMLPASTGYFKSASYEKLSEKNYFRKFIIAIVYSKP